MNDDDAFWRALEEELAATGVRAPLGRVEPIGGGCIHTATRVTAADGQELFVKRNEPAAADAFAAEAEGLAELAAPGVLRTPRPIAHGVAAGQAYLATEHVALAGGLADGAAFGADLARLHGTSAAAFGWHRDNTIGPTPQPNGWCVDWPTFWRERRLGHQLRVAEADGHGRLAERGWRLAERLDALFAGHAPVPALLHGDLWGGNCDSDEHGQAVLFDPAVYYGDHEADLAMTELFGGFPRAFYRGYAAIWPLDAGYDTRRHLYNLYHLLNHAHLFGGGYTVQARRTTDWLLAEVGT